MTGLASFNWKQQKSSTKFKKLRHRIKRPIKKQGSMKSVLGAMHSILRCQSLILITSFLAAGILQGKTTSYSYQPVVIQCLLLAGI